MSGEKSRNHILLIIDPQKDFHGGGSLAIPGADEDSKRIAEMILKNKERIKEIYVSLDTHHKNHISHSAFWLERVDQSKETRAPSDFCQISSRDIKKGKYFPVNEKLLDYCIQYTESLEARKRFTHTIYPEHCLVQKQLSLHHAPHSAVFISVIDVPFYERLIGSVGHAVVESIHNALQQWCTSHHRNVNYTLKGQNCFTEMYSAIEAEVPISSDPSTMTNTVLLDGLMKADKLIICGQALSHCVQYTVRDILKHWTKDKKQICLLIDGSSPVNSVESIKSAELFVHEMKSIITVCEASEVFSQQ